MRDEPLDFLPMIFLLGVVVSICFGLIMPIYKDSRELVYNEVYDKTLARAEGEKYYDDIGEPFWTFQEAVLTLADQEYFMPSPRVIKIGNKAYKIQDESSLSDEAYSGPTDTYLPDTRGTLEAIFEQMRTTCNNINSVNGSINGLSGKAYKLKYTTRLTTGTVEGKTDDCYILCVVAKDRNGKYKYLEVRADGTINTEGKPAAVAKHDITTSAIQALITSNVTYQNTEYFILYE